MDGSRSLRKRKASDEAEDNTHPDHRKRPKRATSELSRTQPIALDGASSPKPRNPPRNVAMETKTLVSPSIRQSRTRGARRSDRPLVTVVEPRSDDNLTLAFHLGSEKLRDLDNEKRKRKRRERERARRANLGRVELPVAEVSHYPALQSSSLALQPLMSDREGDDIKLKPYGGILSEVEAENSKTFPQAVDRKKFEDARLKAEEDWRKKIEAAREAEAARSSQKASGQASKIKCINFNGYEIDTWHAAPYPEEYSRNRVLYICGFCLKYMNSDFVAWRHKVRPSRTYVLRNSKLTSSSSSVPQSIHRATKFIETSNSRSLKSTVERTQSTVRTCAFSPNSSSDPRHCTTTWSLSFSTS